MEAVIRPRPQMFEPERPDEQAEFAASERAPEARRWPLLLSVLLALGVSVAAWAVIILAVAAIF